MKHFTCECMFRGKPITAEITVTDCGVQVGLYGGDKPHVGAVGIVGLDGKITVTQFEGHKEGVLCQQWCGALFKIVKCPVIVSAGVHYDNASKEDILQILEQCAVLLDELINVFKMKSGAIFEE